MRGFGRLFFDVLDTVDLLDEVGHESRRHRRAHRWAVVLNEDRQPRRPRNLLVEVRDFQRTGLLDVWRHGDYAVSAGLAGVPSQFNRLAGSDPGDADHHWCSPRSG